MISFLDYIKSALVENYEDWGEDIIQESEYKGRTVELNKSFRTPSGPKKFSVYVNSDSGNVIKVNFGDPELSIKTNNDGRRRSFNARHKCLEKTDRATPKDNLE